MTFVQSIGLNFLDSKAHHFFKSLAVLYLTLSERDETRDEKLSHFLHGG